MKTSLKFLLLIVAIAAFIWACSSNEETVTTTDDDVSVSDDDPIGGNFETVSVQTILPEGSTIDLANTTLFSLSSDSNINSNGQAELPYNTGTVENAYLLDNDNNVLLAGFITDDRKEITIETTAELIIFYALQYQLLDDSAKIVFVKNIRQTAGFDQFVSELRNAFLQNPLVYSQGGYEQAVQNFLDGIQSKKGVHRIENRIFFNDDATKSGVTLTSVDSTNIMLQNSLPRRSQVIIYKKSSTDRNGEQVNIANYTENPIENFELETGATNSISELEVGSSLATINAQQASIDNTSSTGPILLPVNPSTEFVAEYEVVIIGSGLPQEEGRDMTDAELAVYTEINKKTYVLDYFLPTLLDIGGNKALLPLFGSNKEDALFNAVLPVLEQYPDIIDEVIKNEFKEATSQFLPALYEDVRLSNDLRTILENVYNILSGNGDFPNTFIQSQELIETGLARTNVIMRTIDKNLKANNQFANFNSLRTQAFNFESWLVKSIDAIVEFQQDKVELCLEESVELRVTVITDYDPEVEDFEFHWTTSDEFGGRVQDIGDDPNNFGKSIITKKNYVSYISTALDSELGSGDNLETVTVTLFFRNKNTNELTEAGSDTMLVNNKKGCQSFTASIEQEPIVKEITLLSCGGPDYLGYSANSPINYTAEFEAIDGAKSYLGVVTDEDGSTGPEFTLQNLEEIGNGILRFRTGVGSIRIYETCSLEKAEERAQELLDNTPRVPVSIKITPVF